jgi:hypothetical protein
LDIKKADVHDDGGDEVCACWHSEDEVGFESSAEWGFGLAVALDLCGKAALFNAGTDFVDDKSAEHANEHYEREVPWFTEFVRGVFVEAGAFLFDHKFLDDCGAGAEEEHQWDYRSSET